MGLFPNIAVVMANEFSVQIWWVYGGSDKSGNASRLAGAWDFKTDEVSKIGTVIDRRNVIANLRARALIETIPAIEINYLSISQIQRNLIDEVDSLRTNFESIESKKVKSKRRAVPDWPDFSRFDFTRVDAKKKLSKDELEVVTLDVARTLALFLDSLSHFEKNFQTGRRLANSADSMSEVLQLERMRPWTLFQ